METRLDGSERLRYSCSRSDLPPDSNNGGANDQLQTADLGFQYGVKAALPSSSDNTSNAQTKLANNMEVQIQKELAWRYLFCDYQMEFVNQGFYVHSIDSYLGDSVTAAVDEGCTSGGSTAGADSAPTTNGTANTTVCLTVTARFQIQLVLNSDDNDKRQLESSPSGSVWGLDPKVVDSLGNFLTQLLASEATWKDLPQVESARFRGFVNPSSSAADPDPNNGDGTDPESTANAGNGSSSASKTTDTLLSVLPWVAIALAVLVLGLALFLVLRQRNNGTSSSGGTASRWRWRKKKAKQQDGDASDRNNTSTNQDETQQLEDSYLTSAGAAPSNAASAMTRSSPTRAAAAAAAATSPGSPYLVDEDDEDSLVNSALQDGRLLMMDDSTIGRSELGYSVVDEGIDYSVRELGPSSSFDSQLTDTNVSLLFAGNENISIDGAGADLAAAPAPKSGDALVPPLLSTGPGAPSSAAAPTPPTRLINASLAMRAPHVVSARNRSGGKDPRATSPRNNENTVSL